MLRPCFFAAFSALLWAAQTQPSQEDLTIKLNVELIQLDVTVTDKAKKHVPDLTDADFEVFRDGKRQTIKKVLFVSRPPLAPNGDKTQAKATPPPDAMIQTPPPPPSTRAALLAKDIRRTIAVYIDDLSLSAESIHFMQPALRKFIDQQIQPGDLVAIYRSSGGLGLFQQFTTDKQALLAAVDGVRFRNMNGFDSLAAIVTNPAEDDPDPTIAQQAIEQRQREETLTALRQDMLTANVLSNAAFIVQGLRELPGRKSMVVFSESMQLQDLPQSLTIAGANAGIPGAQGGARQRSVQSMRSLIDVANRCGVTFYTIDPRGLQVLNLTAMDQPSTMPGRSFRQELAREMNFKASQGGMAELAEATGGLFFANTNNLIGAMEAAANDLDGYYLIAFQPDAETFVKSKQGHVKMHQLEIKVRKPGLKVRYRHSFAGVTDAERMPPMNPLLSAMTSPLQSTEIPIKLTPLYIEGDAGPFIRAFFFLDPTTLQFKDEPADPSDKDQTPWKTAIADEMLVLYDQTGKMVDKVAESQSIRLRNKAYDYVLKNGLAQVLDIPVKSPGPYQVRAAVMDHATKLTGSSAQFVFIPDLKKKQLAMSDLTLVTAAFLEAKSTHGTPAQRVMFAGDKLTYGGFLYNVKGANPSLEVQVILYRGGKAIYTGKKVPYRPQGHVEGKSLALSGSLTLGEKFASGEYVMQVAVHDLNAPKKAQYALKSVDFEIRPR